MPNPLIIFDLIGAQAMFRKFYTNSSSLSYLFPPRTTLAGLIAGLMGYEKDTYADDLGLERCSIALSIRVPVRQVMQTVNYVLTQSKGTVWSKNTAGFDGSEGGIQTPIEFIYPTLPHTQLRYRVYITHQEPKWLATLEKLLKTESWVYPPYLGMSECLANVEYLATVANWELAEAVDTVHLSTVVPTRLLDGPPELVEGAQFIKERTPLELGSDRRLCAIGDILYERTGKGIRARVHGPCFTVRYREPDGDLLEDRGVFMA
jgi:CRISPR-associated protein Cas5h